MAFDLKGDFKVPVIGEVPKVLVVGGGLVVGVLVFIHFRNSSSSSSAAAAAGSSATSGSDPYPPDGTVGNPEDPNSTDPATGMTYGDEQVAAANTAGGDSGEFDDGGDLGDTGDEYPWDGTTGNPNDPYSMDPATGETYGDEGDFGGSSSGSGGPPFLSNAAWSQYAEQYLTATVGEDAGTVSAALGPYIAGGKVTTAQQSIIEQAIAYAGNPPVAGTNGMPPGINVSGSSGGGTGAQTKVPYVVGLRATDARQNLRQAGFTVQSTGSSTGVVSAQKPAGNTAASQGTLVTITVKATSGSTTASTQVTVPNVVGKRREDAGPVIRQAGLVATFSAAQGTVSAQSPKAGSKAAKGSTVRLTLKGK